MGICIWSQYELPGVWILRVWCHLHATFQAEKRIMTRTPKKSLEKSLSSFIGSAFFINGFCTGDMYGPVVFQEQGEMDVLSKPRATQVGRSPPSSPTVAWENRAPKKWQGWLVDVCWWYKISPIFCGACFKWFYGKPWSNATVSRLQCSKPFASLTY